MGFDKPTTDNLTATEVISDLPEIVGRVRRGNTRLIVEEDGRPVAAIISARDFDLFQFMLAKREEHFRVLDETRAAFADVPEEEIEREVAKAIASARRKN